MINKSQILINSCLINIHLCNRYRNKLDHSTKNYSQTKEKEINEKYHIILKL